MITRLHLLRPLPLSVSTSGGVAYEIDVARFRIGSQKAWALAFHEAGRIGPLHLLGPLRPTIEEARVDASEGVPVRTAKDDLRQTLVNALVEAGIAESLEPAHSA